jgi:hypothetical protein
VISDFQTIMARVDASQVTQLLPSPRSRVIVSRLILHCDAILCFSSQERKVP